MKIRNLRQLIREEISKIIEEETPKYDEWVVTWTDRDYKEFSKKFTHDPSGPPENARKKAEKFKNQLEDKDKKDQYGLYRSINVKPLT
jgi:hypothetical protein